MKIDTPIDPQLKHYIESSIIPQYNQLDSSHSPAHVHQVIQNSFEIAETLPVDLNIVYTVAAYHDIGLLYGRKNHESNSRKIVEQDAVLPRFFSPPVISMISEAVEDHRASLPYVPRSLYGKIISEADRDLDFERILKRTLLFAYEKKQLTDLEQLHQEAYQYISKKYGPQSELKVWLDYRKNQDGLAIIYQKLAQPESFRLSFEKIVPLVVATSKKTDN